MDPARQFIQSGSCISAMPQSVQRMVTDFLADGEWFFALAPGEKISVNEPGPFAQPSYTPLFSEKFGGYGAADCKEFLSFGAYSNPSPAGRLSRIAGRSKQALRELAAVTKTLFEQAAELCSFDMNEVRNSIADDHSIMRLIRYPGAHGNMAPHKDLGLLTLLASNSESGLEIFQEDRWMPLRIPPGHCALLAGEVLESLSGGRIRAVEHRAAGVSGRERLSVAFFLYPNGDYRLAGGAYLGRGGVESMAMKDYLAGRTKELGIRP